MNCDKCRGELKLMGKSVVNLGTTTQATFFCKTCNEFITFSYSCPTIVKIESEAEFYGGNIED